MQFNDNIEKVIYLFARLMNPDVIFLILLLILLFTYFNINLCLIIILHIIICLSITLSMKRIIARPRPDTCEFVKRLYNLRGAEKNFSMPSGDSLQAANFAVIFYCYFGVKFFFYFIPLVMFARIFYFCHYVGDTIIGVLLGLLTSSLIYKGLIFINIIIK